MNVKPAAISLRRLVANHLEQEKWSNEFFALEIALAVDRRGDGLWNDLESGLEVRPSWETFQTLVMILVEENPSFNKEEKREFRERLGVEFAMYGDSLLEFLEVARIERKLSKIELAAFIEEYTYITRKEEEGLRDEPLEFVDQLLVEGPERFSMAVTMVILDVFGVDLSTSGPDVQIWLSAVESGYRNVGAYR